MRGDGEMTLDWKLIREIFDAIESKPVTQEFVSDTAFAEWDALTVSKHMRLLDHAGLIEAKLFEQPNCTLKAKAGELTMEGYTLHAKLKSDGVWGYVCKTARERSVELSIEVVKSLATKALEAILRQ